MRRVVVTGATGGLGRVFVPRLVAQGCEVVATGRRRELGLRLEGPRVRFVVADLAVDPLGACMAGADTVFHLAALSSPWGPPAQFEAANVTATRRVLDAAKAAGCACVVHVSTPSIYAEPRERLRLTEASPIARRWANDYARTKHEGERLALAADGAAMRTVVLRPRAIVSPFDTALLPRLLHAARRGTLVLPNGGRALIELTDARDVCDALVRAAERSHDVHGLAFNLSGGQPLPLGEIARTVFDLRGGPVRIRSVDARLAGWAARVAEAVAVRWPGRPEPTLTRYGAMVASYSQTFDLTLARTRLGWAPRHTPRESLAWALAGTATPEAADA